MTLITAVTTTGVMLLLFVPDSEENDVFQGGEKQDGVNYIYKSVTYHADVNIKDEFREVYTSKVSETFNQESHNSITANPSINLISEENGQTVQIDIPDNFKDEIVTLEPIGALDMNAQGSGKALQIALSITNGKLELSHCTSIPKSVVKRSPINAANHLIIFKDSTGEELLAQAVQFQKLRPAHPKQPTWVKEPDLNYEEYNTVMKFAKFPREAKFLEVYSFDKAYVPAVNGSSVKEFIKDSGQTLKLTHRGLLK